MRGAPKKFDSRVNALDTAGAQHATAVGASPSAPARSGARRAKHRALQACFRRVLRQRGPKQAVVAVAHALVRVVYHVLADGTVYREAGANSYDRHQGQRVTRRALQTLERQGYRVTLEPAA